MNTIRVFALMILFLPSVSLGQTEDPGKMQQVIDSLIQNHPYRFLIFRMRPKLAVSSGYDSNAFAIPETGSGIEDYYGSISPGGSIAAKLGRHACFVLDEDINFLYYRDLEQLRDIFNTTSLKFVTGTRSLLLTVGGNFTNKKAPINHEFDIPAQQKLKSGNAELFVGLGRRIDVKFQFVGSQFLYTPSEGVDVSLLNPPPDTQEVQYGAGIEYLLARRLRLFLSGSIGKTKFLVADTEIDFSEILAGFDYSKNRFTLSARIGADQRDSNGELVYDADADYKLRRRLSIGGSVIRKRRVSAFQENGFSLFTEQEFRGSFPLARRFFLDGKFRIGKNNYGDQFFLNEMLVTKDTYRLVESGLNFELPKNLILRTGATYLKRNSNIPLLSKDRFTYNVGISFQFWE